MEKSTAGTKERSPDNLSLPKQNTILINIKWYYFTRYGKKYNEIQLTKNKMYSNNRKMPNHPLSPATGYNRKMKVIHCWANLLTNCGEFSTTERWRALNIQIRVQTYILKSDFDCRPISYNKTLSIGLSLAIRIRV